jgi:hypothetical protein
MIEASTVRFDFGSLLTARNYTSSLVNDVAAGLAGAERRPTSPIRSDDSERLAMTVTMPCAGWGGIDEYP